MLEVEDLRRDESLRREVRAIFNRPLTDDEMRALWDYLKNFHGDPKQ